MHASIAHMLDAAADDAAEITWLVTDRTSLTFGQARAEVDRMAAVLRDRGVGHGDRVVVTTRNTPEYLMNWFALMRLGAIQVPVNPAATSAELSGLVGQVRPRLLVTDPGLTPLVTGAAPGIPTLDVTAPTGGAVPPTRDAEPAVAVGLDDIAVMIPTSGTTGRSKLVMQTHRAYVMAGEGFPWWMQLTSDDRLMTSLPLFHVNAPAYSVLGSLAARAGLVLLESFSAGGFLDAARRHGATEFNAIGAMLEILMRQPPRPDDADTPLRRCYTGPSPTRERQLEIERRFGLEIVCGYGLSESPLGLIWPHGSRPYGTLGTVRQHPELGVVNEARVMGEDGSPVGIGEVGELELRNPAIMAGYFEMPEETEAVIAGGWLRTGDLVTAAPDGTYMFVARKKEVIRRRGENLAPAEVEACLERHPSVAEAAVVGVASELTEEEVKAFLTAAPGRTIDVAELHRHAAEALAAFKVPRYYEVVDHLPHTPTGRVAKHHLPRDRTPEEIDMDATTAHGHPTPPDGDDAWLQTSLGTTTPDTISIGGRDLPSELMGRLTLTELAYLLIVGREPTEAERVLVDAVLVSLADHGHTPSALATRLTYTGAPEAVQAAVAAGLLGAGSVFLGPSGDTAVFLADAVSATGLSDASDPADHDRVARALVAERVAAGLRIPGLGHPVHREGDPRTPRLYEIARQVGLLGPHLRLLDAVAAAHADASGTALPVNGAGAGGAALADAGVPAGVVRGVVLIARAAGLVGHLAEEMRSPIGRRLWLEIEDRARPMPP